MSYDKPSNFNNKPLQTSNARAIRRARRRRSGSKRAGKSGGPSPANGSQQTLGTGMAQTAGGSLYYKL
jgi:hypothetical protein